MGAVRHGLPWGVRNDATAVGAAGQARSLIETVAVDIEQDRLVCHFHDTYGQAFANV